MPRKGKASDATKEQMILFRMQQAKSDEDGNCDEDDKDTEQS